MTRSHTIFALAFALSIGTAGGALAQAQAPGADKPPATNDTTGMRGDPSKNAESAPKAGAGGGTTGTAPGTAHGSSGVQPESGAKGR